MNEPEIIALLIKELEGYLDYCNFLLREEPSISGFTKYLRRKTSNG